MTHNEKQKGCHHTRFARIWSEGIGDFPAGVRLETMDQPRNLRVFEGIQTIG